MIKATGSIRQSSKQFLFIGGWLLSACIALPCSSYAQGSGLQPMRNPFLPPTPQATTAVVLPMASPPTMEIAVYRLNYASAEDIKDTINSIFPNNRLGFDRNTNSIIFTGTPIEHQHLQQLLPSLDAATKQVTLEAKLIAISDEFSKQLGVNWSWDTIPQKATDDKDDDTDYNGSFKFWHGYAFKFNTTLNALIANGKAKILAKPRIITIPGKEASIFIGDHIPVQTEKHDSGGYYTSTEYIDAGIQLKYKPIISSVDGLVTAQVHTEVSTPTLISELKNYRITSRTADTNVRMHSGETLIIGGLINEEEQRSLQKVPLLSNIPLVGELFKNRTTKKNKTEVLIILTPYVTEAGQSPAIYNEESIKQLSLQNSSITNDKAPLALPNNS